MSRIRSDLVGVVTVRDSGAQLVTLSPGDEIPEDVLEQVGDHVIEADEQPGRRRQSKSE